MGRRCHRAQGIERMCHWAHEPWGAYAIGPMSHWAHEPLGACAIGCTRVELWSDTLFERAHRFYTKHGFRHDGVIRHMTDSHEPYDELLFYKEIEQ